MEQREYVFCCPGCNQVRDQDSAVLLRQYSVRALYLPFFMCRGCRLIYYDKTLIRQTISRWRNSPCSPVDYPYREICAEMKKYIEKIIEYYCRTASYKRAKFIKKLI